MLTGTRLFASSARDGPQRLTEAIMKRTRNTGQAADPTGIDEILPEYDFSRVSRNKYAVRYAAGSPVVVLEPDVAAAFPSSEEANEALRALAGIIQKRRSRRSSPHRDSMSAPSDATDQSSETFYLTGVTPSIIL
jgi:hypothetical protein